jgi:hypothetical protein
MRSMRILLVLVSACIVNNVCCLVNRILASKTILHRYGDETAGDAMLQTDLALTVGAHRRVFRAKVQELCAVDAALQARQLEQHLVQKRQLQAELLVTEQQEIQDAEAKSRIRLIEAERQRLQTNTQSPAMTAKQRLGLAPALKSSAPAAAAHSPELASQHAAAARRRAMVDKQLLSVVGSDISDPVPEEEEDPLLRHDSAYVEAAAAEAAISVKVRTAAGWRKMAVGQAVLVSELADALSQLVGVPATDLTIVHRLRPLPTHESLRTCGVEDNAILHVRTASRPRSKLLLLG